MRPLVVVGDSLLDVDVEGPRRERGPDAAAPVVDVETEWQRAGGAALAATLATWSTAEVILVTAIGDDAAGRRLWDLLPSGVQVVSTRLHGATAVKQRIRADGQPLARLDHGCGMAGHGPLPPSVMQALNIAGAVLVSDYGRGMASHPSLREQLRDIAGRTPVVWDPHPRGPSPVPGAELLTPNESEARWFAGEGDDAAGLAAALRGSWSCRGVAVTMGARGAVLANGSADPVRVPPPSEPGACVDACGAGDRFASSAAISLMAGADARSAVADAVADATRFVRGGGASGVSTYARPRRITRLTEPSWDAFALAERVRRAGGRLVATGGCFDLLHPGHVGLLRRARALGDALVVCLNDDASVKRLKGDGRPLLTAADRVEMLSAYPFVDAVVVFDEDTPAAILDTLRPDIWAKGAEYAGVRLPEADAVRRHGGRVELLSRVDGHSTTNLIAASQWRHHGGERCEPHPTY